MNLSHSRISVFNGCKRKFRLKYIDKLLPKTQKMSLHFGKLFHASISEMYLTGDLKKANEIIENETNIVDKFYFNQKDFDDLEWAETVLKAGVQHWYTEFYYNDVHRRGLTVIGIENKYKNVPIINPKTKRSSRNFKYTFIPDMIAELDGKLWLFEYKTASRVDMSYFSKLAIDQQIVGYMSFLEKALNRKFEGVIYRILKKPQIRQKQTETRSDFFNRLLKIVPDCISEHKIYISDSDIHEFKSDLWGNANSIGYSIKNKIYPKNTGNCMSFGKCEYLPICTNASGADDYFKKGEN